jgi:hypothetical protein
MDILNCKTFAPSCKKCGNSILPINLKGKQLYEVEIPKVKVFLYKFISDRRGDADSDYKSHYEGMRKEALELFYSCPTYFTECLIQKIETIAHNAQVNRNSIAFTNERTIEDIKIVFICTPIAFVSDVIQALYNDLRTRYLQKEYKFDSADWEKFVHKEIGMDDNARFERFTTLAEGEVAREY